MIKYKASVNIASVGINILSIAVFLYIYYSTKDEWVLLPVFFFASVLIFEVKRFLRKMIEIIFSIIIGAIVGISSIFILKLIVLKNYRKK